MLTSSLSFGLHHCHWWTFGSTQLGAFVCHFHRPWQSPFAFLGITSLTRMKISPQNCLRLKKNFSTGWPCQIITVNRSPGGVWWMVRMGRSYSIFILSIVWSGESSAELEKLGETWWKSWLSGFVSGDNHTFSYLIIKAFDNQTPKKLPPSGLSGPLSYLILVTDDLINFDGWLNQLPEIYLRRRRSITTLRSLSVFDSK